MLVMMTRVCMRLMTSDRPFLVFHSIDVHRHLIRSHLPSSCHRRDAKRTNTSKQRRQTNKQINKELTNRLDELF